MPQVTPYASYGGLSILFAQLDLDKEIPIVFLPSFIVGLNAISVFTDSLYSLIVFNPFTLLTPFNLLTNSSKVLAVTLVTPGALYSLYQSFFTFLSNICQAN